MKADKLLERIEEIRQELHSLIKSTDITSEVVLAKSQELDEVTIRYQKMAAENNTYMSASNN